MRLFLIRHGKQDTELCNTDIGLSAVGKMQASKVGERLSRYPIDAIYASDMIRARETAGMIKEQLKDQSNQLEIEIRPSIREISFGQLENIHSDTMKIMYHDFFMEQRRLEEDLPYPGGENGQQVFERAFPVLEEIVKTNHEYVVIVTHGGVIRSLLSGMLGMEQGKKLLFGWHLQHGSITELVYSKEEERFYVQRFNDFAHIEELAENIMLNDRK